MSSQETKAALLPQAPKELASSDSGVVDYQSNEAVIRKGKGDEDRINASPQVVKSKLSPLSIPR